VTAGFNGVPSGGTVSVLLGNGLGSFGAPQNFAAGSFPRSVALADFNLDGNLDVVTANGDNGTVSVLLGTGSGSFKPPLSAAAGSYPQGVAVGNFNGAGGPDVASANYGSNNVSVLLNDGNWPALDAPSITISNASVAEGNTGTTVAEFTVTLSAASTQTVTVHYATADYSALAGSDYQAAEGTLVFDPGETMMTIPVLVIGDRVVEDGEYFYLRLSDSTNAFVANAERHGSIVDDEPRLSINSVSLTEGNSGTKLLTFTVTLSAQYDEPVTVNYATQDSSATVAGNDYVATSGMLTFAPGQTTKTFTVTIKGDKGKESNESFYVLLSGASDHSQIDNAYGWGTILNDDGGGKGSGKGNHRLSSASAFDAAIEDWMTSTQKRRGR
jgi:Calx-beta domain/FG-GAP-like repeat